MGAAIEVRGIVNRFGDQVVHDGLDVDIRAGEVFGIVGGSGSGKSVLLRTMLGLQRPVSGSVRIEGREVTNRRERELHDVKRRYGVMFQRGALFSSLTVQQNVELPIREHYPMPAALLSGLAQLRIRMVGLAGEDAAKYPSQLSGGMTKRAALARALALDPISAAAFDALVLELQEGLSLTVVMITHDLDTIFRVCNRVGVIVDGRMISGTLDEIVRNENPWIQQYFHGERSRAMHGRAVTDG
jgi:phospholipid/cholesterol/gamma-HCH transport system ATP-binding protein